MVKVLPPADILSQNQVHSPKRWEQIENPEEVRRVLDRIRGATRFDVYRCAEQYELAYPGYEGDLPYYLEKGKSGRVLYLGVGTGRIFGKLAEKNPAAVGLDNSPEMLEMLRRHYPSIKQNQVLLADAVNAPLAENQFDTVIAPYSFLQVVEEKHLPDLLKSVHKWLKPGGTFHTDMFSPYLIPFRRKGLEASVRQVCADTRIAIYITYDHERQHMTEMALIDSNGDEQVLEMNLHYYFPREINAALTAGGFESSRMTGGYKGEPFDPTENEVLVFETRKAMPREGLLSIGENGRSKRQS